LFQESLTPLYLLSPSNFAFFNVCVQVSVAKKFHKAPLEVTDTLLFVFRRYESSTKVSEVK